MMKSGRGGLRTRDLRIAQVQGSACLSGGRRLPKGDRTESRNPMSAALCPAKPPGLPIHTVKKCFKLPIFATQYLVFRSRRLLTVVVESTIPTGID